MIDAQWLFENYRLIQAQEKYLRFQISHMLYPNGQRDADADEILARVLARPSLCDPPQRNAQGSSTERVALQLQGKETDQSKSAMNDYLENLSCCQFLLEIYDAIVSAITPNEAWLVIRSFQKKS